MCSFKKCKTKDTISKLIINGRTMTNSQDICNGFNQYFSTVDHIHNELVKNNNNSNLNFATLKSIVLCLLGIVCLLHQQIVVNLGQ